MKDSYSSIVLTGEYFDNPSGCKHDRRCYVQLTDVNIYVVWEYTDPYGNKYPFMEGTIELWVEAWGTARNWLCKWNDYKTLLAYRNVSYTVNVYQNDLAIQYPYQGDMPPNTSSIIVPFSGTIPDYAPGGDHYSICGFDLLGHCIINEFDIYEEMNNNYLGFISAHAEATSRGILYYVNWAVINE